MASELNRHEREKIAQLWEAGESKAEIARQLERHPSSIGRELRRNGEVDNYSAVVAQTKADARRRQRPLLRKLERPEVNAYVRHGLGQRWSPEQIAGRLRRDFRRQPRRWVSHTTIYRWIAGDCQTLGPNLGAFLERLLSDVSAFVRNTPHHRFMA
jgi:IS30 family transposase